MPFVNPQNGPISCRARKRATSFACAIDTLSRGPQPAGTSALIPIGGLVGNADADAQRAPARAGDEIRSDRNGTFEPELQRGPFEPFIGTLGVSPQIEAVLSWQPTTAATWTFPMSRRALSGLGFQVHAKGAYLYLGDCHGRQGDGELCGVAVEIPSTTTIQVDLIKSWAINWPRLENEHFLMNDGRFGASDGVRGLRRGSPIAS